MPCVQDRWQNTHSQVDTDLDDGQIKDFPRFSDLWVVPVLGDDVRGQGAVGHFLRLPSFQELRHLETEQHTLTRETLHFILGLYTS